MKHLKRIAALSLVFCMLLMAACGGSTSTGSTGDSGSSGGSGGSSGGDVTLRVIESLTSTSRTAVIREIADAYEAQNPGVKIEIVSPPQEGADEKIAQMLMNGQDMDIVEVREQTITQFQNNGWIIELDGYVDAWQYKDTLTSAATQSMTAIGGKTYMIPYGFYQRCLFYRKDIFDAAGLQPPNTWQELLEVGEQLTNPDENRYGYAFRGGNGGNQYAEMCFMGWLGTDNIAHPDAAFYFEDGTTIFTTPEAREALEFHKELYQKASPSDSVAWGFSEMVQGFLNGTAAMLIQDSEVIANCQEELEDDQWATHVLPTGPSGQSVSPNGYAGWGITSFSEHQDLAADFILFLSQSENNATFAQSQMLIPIHSTAAEDPFFSEGAFAPFMEMANDPDTYRFAMRPQMYQTFASYKVEIDQEFQKYLKDIITTDEMLQILDDIWSKAYEEEGKLW